MIKVLVYCWKSLCEPMAVRAMEEMGMSVVKIEEEVKDYHTDAAFSQKCFHILNNDKIDAIFSYDYYPILSMIAQVVKLPYISWIFDCPMYTLKSKTLVNECNHIFCFDKVYAKRLREDGGKHIYPFLLGTDMLMFKRAWEANKKDEKYACDISFVGSLYNEDSRRLKQELLTDYTKGYTEGIISAQMELYGCNIVRDTLTNAVTAEIVEAGGLFLGEFYRNDPKSMAADAINKEITGRERLAVVNRISSNHDINIYTGSSFPAYLRDRITIHSKGYVDYNNQMPIVFNQSKINLNITAKTIESGIPQRIMDILACGGFCLTNYQPEIAEYLEDGKDIVMYESMKDMEEKIDYYLAHEEERQEIAENGQKRAAEIFDIRDKAAEMEQMILAL